MIALNMLRRWLNGEDITDEHVWINVLESLIGMEFSVGRPDLPTLNLVYIIYKSFTENNFRINTHDVRRQYSCICRRVKVLNNTCSFTESYKIFQKILLT